MIISPTCLASVEPQRNIKIRLEVGFMADISFVTAAEQTPSSIYKEYTVGVLTTTSLKTPELIKETVDLLSDKISQYVLSFLAVYIR